MIDPEDGPQSCHLCGKPATHYVPDPNAPPSPADSCVVPACAYCVPDPDGPNPAGRSMPMESGVAYSFTLSDGEELEPEDGPRPDKADMDGRVTLYGSGISIEFPKGSGWVDSCVVVELYGGKLTLYGWKEDGIDPGASGDDPDARVVLVEKPKGYAGREEADPS